MRLKERPCVITGVCMPQRVYDDEKVTHPQLVGLVIRASN